MALGGSGVDGLDSRFISSSSSPSWWIQYPPYNFFSSLISLAGFYFGYAFFAVREKDFFFLFDLNPCEDGSLWLLPSVTYGVIK